METSYNYESYLLSRLEIIGGRLDDLTPNLVIYEIAICHGVQVSKEECSFDNKNLINIILSTVPKKVSRPFNQESWAYVARYINPNVSRWRETKLNEAFNFLLSLREAEINSLDPNFQPGLQTMENPYSICACILYAFCLKNNLRTWKTMTYDQLALSVKCNLLNSNFIFWNLFTPLLTNKENFKNNCLQIVEKLNLSGALPNYDDKINYENLLKTSKEIRFQRIIERNFIPLTSCQAIVMAAQKWSVDISFSKFPIEELRLIQKDGVISYQPFDKNMAKYYFSNPELFSLEFSFNPLLPGEFYNHSSLRNMITSFGHRPDNNYEGMYSQLCELYLCDNFYHGIRPNIKNKESPFDLDNIDELNSDEIVCFGNNNDGFTFFTYKELAFFLKYNKAYLHPLEKRNYLSPEHQARLRFLANNPPQHNREKAIEYLEEFKQALIYVDIFISNNDEILRNFCNDFQKISDELKEKIRNSFFKLLEMGYYMRNWLGPNDPEGIPISDIARDRNQLDVIVRTSEAIRVYEESLNEISQDWKQIINNLPLVKFEGTSFVISSDQVIGLTLGDKINLIKSGEDINNIMGTCIKVSSGWIICSAYRYLIAIGVNLNIDISSIIYVAN